MAAIGIFYFSEGGNTEAMAQAIAEGCREAGAEVSLQRVEQANPKTWPDLDAIILGAAISRELRFVAKAELWRSKLLAWMIEGLGAIPIERGHSDYLAATRVLHALEAGQAVVIFPQGAVRGDRAWKQGAAHAALLTGAPLVPVRLVGTARALSRGRIGFPRLRVIIGEPIEVARAPEDPDAAAKLTERLRVAVESLA